MREAVIIGVAAGLAVFFLQGLVPRIGTGEIAWFMRMVGSAAIGAGAGAVIHFIRR